MGSLRKYSPAAGLFYLLTFVSIPTLGLYRSVRGPSFATGPGPDLPVIVGVLLEMIVALAGIGTAVALYPVVSRQGQHARWASWPRACWRLPPSTSVS